MKNKVKKIIILLGLLVVSGCTENTTSSIDNSPIDSSTVITSSEVATSSEVISSPEDNSSGNLDSSAVAESYTINNVDDLKNITNDLFGVYNLACDLQLVDQWSPIGSEDNRFMGEFNGNGHTISGLTLTNNVAITEFEDEVSVHSGLFGFSEGIIHDLKLTNVNINVAYNISDEREVKLYVGAIAGESKNEVYNVDVQGNVTLSALSPTGRTRGGLILGKNTGKLNHSNASGTIKAYVDEENARVGGVVGEQSTGSVKTTSAKVDVNVVANGAGNVNVGGLIGLLESGNVENCYVNTNLIKGEGKGSKSKVYAGGITGYIGYKNATKDASISNSYAKATVDAYSGTDVNHKNNAAYAGGLAGVFYQLIDEVTGGPATQVTLQNSFFQGTVKTGLKGLGVQATSEVYAEGASGTINVSNCYTKNGSLTIAQIYNSWDMEIWDVDSESLPIFR